MKRFLIILFISSFFISCGGDSFTPKPKGYFRIDLPEKGYHQAEKDCPFTFEVPQYSMLKSNVNNPDQPCWFNIEFPKLNASIYVSYKVVNNNIAKFLEDSRTLAFKHTVKAFDIEQELVSIPKKKVYGLIYDIQGNAASSYQFHLTDSVQHFIRGSLYFNSEPNQDSIQPALDFIKQDVKHFIETFEWKYE